MTHTARNHKGNRRAELLKVAREVFAEKGFEATTIAEIVARAGVAQGTFYWYFPSKASLITMLAKEMQDQIEEALRSAYVETTHLGEMIDRSVQGAFQIMAQYRDVLAMVSSARWAEAPSERERVFAPYYHLIAQLIRNEQARGILESTINPDVTAILIVGTVYYAADECYVYNSPIAAEVFISEAAQFIRRALGIDTPAHAAPTQAPHAW